MSGLTPEMKAMARVLFQRKLLLSTGTAYETLLCTVLAYVYDDFAR